MADSHDPQAWWKLLTQFQEGHAKFSKSGFYLEGLTSATRFKLDKARSNCLQDYLGFVSWFVERAGRTEERNFYVHASIDFISGALDDEMRELSLEALKNFCPLAAQSGAHLPLSVRDAIPGKHRDAGSMWCSLLWWFNAEHCFDSSKILDTTNLVSSCPFGDSIRVIEGCGLTGDSPSFPFSVSFTNDKVKVEADKTEVCEEKRAKSDEATQDESDNHTSEKQPEKGGRGEAAKIPTKEANVLVRDYLKKHATQDHRITIRELVENIKPRCSQGGISNTLAWRAYQNRLKAGSTPKTGPKTVSLTPKLEAVTGKKDRELERLMNEQKADIEPSPLDPDPVDSEPTTVRERKRL